MISRVLTLSASTLVLASGASAAVTITPSSSNVQVLQNVEDPPGSGAYTIVLKDNSSAFNTSDSWTITTNNTTDRINSIAVQAPFADRTLYLNIGTPSNKFASIGTIQYDSESGNRNGKLWVNSLRCSGDVAHINVHAVTDTLIDGSVTGGMSMVPVFFTPPGIVTMTVRGDIRGDILLPDALVLNERRGFIQNLTVIGNLKRTDGSPVLVRASRHVRIEVTGDANIDLAKGASDSTSPAVRRLTAGNLEGVIRARGFEVVGSPPQAFITATGEFNAVVALENALTTPGPDIVTINAPDGALKGRVIINSSNNPDEQIWTAPVRVGDPATSGYSLVDHYTPTTSQLGGGSAGLVPFAVHKTDCNPAQSATVPPSGPSGAPFVRYDGPVDWTGSTDPLVATQRKVDAGAGDPTNDLSACFSHKPGADDTRVNFELKNNFLPVGDYTVKAAAGVLKNDILGTLTGDVRTGADGELTFSVRWPCLGDLNDDSNVDTADLILLLGQFGQSSACGMSRDLDGDLGVNTADLTLFLGRFGTTPPEQAPLPPVLAALGFTTVEGSISWVGTLTQAERDAHVIELIESIQPLQEP